MFPYVYKQLRKHKGLHVQAKLDMLCVQREMLLLCLMYDLKQKSMYEKDRNHSILRIANVPCHLNGNVPCRL